METNGDAFRGQIRLAGYQRLSHGLYQPDRPGLSAEQELLRELAALLLVLPEDAVYTHVTAAKLLGWQIPQLPERVPVFAAVRGERHPRRHGLAFPRRPPSAVSGRNAPPCVP